MRIIFVLVMVYLPSFLKAQLMVKDTTLNGRTYHVYPFKIDNVDSKYGNNYENEDGADMAYILKRLTVVPSVTDSLPDGDYILLGITYKKGNRNSKSPFVDFDFEPINFLAAKFAIHQGQKNGACQFFDAKGKINTQGQYLNDLQEGNWQWKEKTRTCSFSYRKGVLEGEFTAYYKNTLIQKFTYKGGQILGNYATFYNNGKPKYFTKYIRYEERITSPNGEYRTPLSEQDSIEFEFYPNGQLIYRREIHMGWASLNSVTYHPDGKIKSTTKIIKYLEDEDRYLLERFDNSGTYMGGYSKSIYKSISSDLYSSSINLKNVYYSDEGDTISVDYLPPETYSMDPIYLDSIIVLSKYFKKIEGRNVLDKISYYNPVIGMFEQTFDKEGNSYGETQLRITPDKHLYIVTKNHYFSDKRFKVAFYQTYSLDTFLKGNSYTPGYGYGSNYQSYVVPISDSVLIYLDGKLYTGDIVYPTAYYTKAKHQFWRKLRIKLKLKKGYGYEYGYELHAYNSFDLWQSNFKYMTLSNREFYKKYVAKTYYSFPSGSDETDSLVNVLMPVLQPESGKYVKIDKLPSYYLGPALKIVNGKYEGEVTIKNETFNYVHGVKNGVYKEGDRYSSDKGVGYYKNGLKNGEFSRFIFGEKSSFGLAYKVTYVNDTLHGPVVIYDNETNQPSMWYNYNKGKITGSLFAYSPITSDTFVKANFVDGFFDGKVEENVYRRKNLDEMHYDRNEYVSDQNGKPILFKSHLLNFSKGYYKGTQCRYGESGYLLQKLELTDSNIEYKDESGSSDKVRYTEKPSFRSEIFDYSGGYYTFYYKNGMVAEEGLKDSVGAKKGVWKYYREDGSIYKQIEYGDVPTQPAELHIQGERDLRFYGYYTSYHRNGKVHEKGFVFEVTYGYDCNQERSIQSEEVTYSQVFDSTGKLIFDKGSGDLKVYYANGLLRAKGKQLNGLREGFWIFYDLNGNPIEAGNYKSDFKDGRWLRGDLRGLHFIDNQCFDEHTEEELLKSKQEENLSIEETIYDMGNVLSSNHSQILKNK